LGFFGSVDVGVMSVARQRARARPSKKFSDVGKQKNIFRSRRTEKYFRSRRSADSVLTARLSASVRHARAGDE
jgi:hypothetical protein